MNITLRGAQFSPVWGASGVSNFHSQIHYWFHWWLRPFGHDFTGTTDAAKTSTLPPRAGNMPLKEDGVTPKERFPRCIYVDRLLDLALNAVSLSGPGFEALIEMDLWQKLARDYQISLMSLAKTPEARLAELSECFRLVNYLAKQSRSPVGAQINGSCPNGGLDPRSLVNEMRPVLDAAEEVIDRRIPVGVKLGPDAHPEAGARIAAHPRCDFLVVLNTLKFGSHPTWATETPPVDWKKLFGTSDPAQSPIAKRFPGFPGGLSGLPLRPFVIEWVRKARALGVTKHINAGSQFTRKHLLEAKAAGADSVAIGSISFLHPLNVRPLIRDALEIFG